ncbi:MAG: PASTA domain-containing protein [Myxococcota bacterium]
MQSFFVAFFTALIVSTGVSAFFHYGLAQPVVASQESNLVEVPNLAGMTLETARSHLTANGLVPGGVTESVSDTVPAGQVIATRPNRQSMVKRGIVLEIETSAGNPLVKVPDLNRMNASKARATLESLNLKLEIRYINSGEYAFDRVLKQEPEADTEVKPGSAVVVTINAETN